MGLGVLDWIILAILGFSTVVGFFVGFIRSILSVLVWVVAVVVSMYFGPALAQSFSSVTSSPDIQLWLSYGTVFIVTFLVGWVVKFVVGMFCAMSRPSFLNNMLGAGFGFIRGILLIVILMWFAMLAGANQTAFYQGSHLAPAFTGLTTAVAHIFPGASAAVQSSVAALNSESQGLMNSAGSAGGNITGAGTGGMGMGSGNSPFSGSSGTGGAGGTGGMGLNGMNVGGIMSQIQSIIAQASAAIKANLGHL